MRAGNVISISKEAFLKLAPRGLILEAESVYFMYDSNAPTFPSRYSDYIPGYVYKDKLSDSVVNPINGLWNYFLYPNLKFTVIQPPVLPISKPKDLHDS